MHRESTLADAESFEIIEEYPDDKYLPSYLIRAQYANRVFHIQVATDTVRNNIRIVTAYIPDPNTWADDFRTRRGMP